jgi:hypothetical protein
MNPEAREQVAQAIRRGIAAAKAAKEKHMERGTIIDAKARGGLLSLTIRGPDGTDTEALGDNGPTVRALMGIFGREIVRGHTLLVDRVIGQEIVYELDDLGLLVSIGEPE